MLNATLLFDDRNRSLSTKERRKKEYELQSKQHHIELITKTSTASTANGR